MARSGVEWLVSGTGRVDVAEDFQDRPDDDAIFGADRDDADSYLLPLSGVRHLVRPPPGHAENRSDGGQVGCGAKTADRFVGPLAHWVISLLVFMNSGRSARYPSRLREPRRGGRWHRRGGHGPRAVA